MKNVLSSIHSLWVQCENAQSVYVNLLRFSYVGGNYALKGCAIYHFFFYYSVCWSILTLNEISTILLQIFTVSRKCFSIGPILLIHDRGSRGQRWHALNLTYFSFKGAISNPKNYLSNKISHPRLCCGIWETGISNRVCI